jgi:hypothetical protein
MSYTIGPKGPTGIVGTQGLQGKCGPIGPPIGPTGKAFSVVGTSKLNIKQQAVSGPITLSPLTTIYNLYQPGDITVTLPSGFVNYPLTEQSGVHWTFKNNTMFPLNLTFTGDYSGTNLIPIGQVLILILYVDANCIGTYSTI